MSTPPDKARRMELRSLRGHRPSPAVAYLPSAGYLVAHACFECRRSVKVRRCLHVRCPECAGPLSELGRTFRAPKRSDIKQWKKVEILWLAGYRFGGYRSGALPETLKEAQAFIVEQRALLLPKRG